MGIGSELRDARLRAGLSAKQLADRTKLKLAKIEALEKSDFESLPHGIYLDGVVKAYAHEVGFDAKLAVQRVHEEIADAEEGEWVSEEVAAPPREKENATGRTRPTIVPMAAVPARAEAETAVRPASAVAAAEPRRSSRPRFSPRSVAFAVFAALAAIGAGMYLRSLTRTNPVAHATGVVRTDAQSAVRDTDVATGRKDGSLAPGGPVSPPPPAVPPRAVSDAGDAAAEPAIPGVNSSDVTGTWDLTTQVESTKIENIQGRRFGYRINLRQNGDQVRGSGYRVMENGKTVAGGGRTPITLQGTIDGRELVLTFTEQSEQGRRGGRFVLNLGADLALRGSFQSDGATSRGSISARRRR